MTSAVDVAHRPPSPDGGADRVLADIAEQFTRAWDASLDAAHGHLRVAFTALIEASAYDMTDADPALVLNAARAFHAATDVIAAAGYPCAGADDVSFGVRSASGLLGLLYPGAFQEPPHYDDVCNWLDGFAILANKVANAFMLRRILARQADRDAAAAYAFPADATMH